MACKYHEWDQEDGSTLLLESYDDSDLRLSVMGAPHDYEERGGYMGKRRDGEDSEVKITKEIASELIVILEETFKDDRDQVMA